MKDMMVRIRPVMLSPNSFRYEASIELEGGETHSVVDSEPCAALARLAAFWAFSSGMKHQSDLHRSSTGDV